MCCVLFSPFLAFLGYFSQLGVKAYHFPYVEMVCILLKGKALSLAAEILPPGPKARALPAVPSLAPGFDFARISCPAYLAELESVWEQRDDGVMTNLFLFPSITRSWFSSPF